MRLKYQVCGLLVVTVGWYAWLFWQLAAPRERTRQVVVFVGGLQRSGTTVAASLMAELVGEEASLQSLEGAASTTMDRVRKRRGVSQSYLADVLASGGLEGKIVQDVYPYKYFLRDWGDGQVARFAAGGAEAATPAKAQRLWRQWAEFWDTSKRVLIEKTPENVAMSPFLQRLFDDRETAFLVVLRHPLAWALAVDKWLKNKWNRRKTVDLLPMSARLNMWLVVVGKFFDDAPGLRRKCAVHAERLDLAESVDRQRLIRDILSRLTGSAPSDLAHTEAFFEGYARANLQYVSCWLAGGRVSRRDRSCQSDRGQVLLADRARELDELRITFQANVSAFGYGLPDFARNLCAVTCAPPADDRLEANEVGLELGRIATRYRPYIVL